MRMKNVVRRVELAYFIKRMDREKLEKEVFKLYALNNYVYFAHHLGIRSFMCGYCGGYICDLPANAELISKILNKVLKHACLNMKYAVWRDEEKPPNDMPPVQEPGSQ